MSCHNHQHGALIPAMHEDLRAFFAEPKTAKQRQYEALRAYAMDGMSAAQAAHRFGFTESSVYALARDLRGGKLDFFPRGVTGPRQRRLTPYVRDKILSMRESNLSVEEIAQRLNAEDSVHLGTSTVERVLKDVGHGKLHRRTAVQRGFTKSNTLIPETAHNLDFEQLQPFCGECQVAGIFFFLPYIIESGIMEALSDAPVPQSGRIGKSQALLSLLALKLIGGQRLCHVRQYDHDQGFGVFAGLNVLPKPTYAGTYSCLMSAQACRETQRKLIATLAAKEPKLFSGTTINLDFHSIPHFGDQSQMENVWCGSRNKAMKAANTFFAQDAQTNAVLYANSDVLRRDAAQEVLRFVEFMRAVKGVVDQTLVFDSRLTKYEILGQLDHQGIRFITLRTRSKGLVQQILAEPASQWLKVHLPIPKRKHQDFFAHESDVVLPGCERPLRQIVVKDHGRAEPTFVITNNRELPLTQVLTVYAHRWHIENKLAELVDFFNLNALSSPIMVRIHFDLLLSVVASFLYHRFAQDLPRFEKQLAPAIFRDFIDMPGKVRFDGKSFEVRLRKRSHTPVLLGVAKLAKPIEVPWLGGRQLQISFTP